MSVLTYPSSAGTIILASALEDKTRVLVTHRTQYLPSCDMIVVLGANGTMLARGPYPMLATYGLDTLVTTTTHTHDNVGEGKVTEAGMVGSGTGEQGPEAKDKKDGLTQGTVGAGKERRGGRAGGRKAGSEC